MIGRAPAQLRALILAGARETGDPLCESEGVSSKAIIDIAGKPMIVHVHRALCEAGISEPIWVLGGERDLLASALSKPDLAHIDATGAGPAASLSNAFAGPVSPPLLVTTADHPLLTPEIIRHFVSAAQESSADLFVGFARRATIEPAFPATRRTYLPIGERDLSSCNLFYIANEKAVGALKHWQRVEADRKHPWRMVRRLGLLFLLRLFVARRSSQKVFELLSERMGASIDPIILPFAEAAVDVDTLADLRLVRTIFEKTS